VTAVLVDGYALSDGSGSRGIGTYLRRILTGLASRPGFDVQVLADPHTRLPPGNKRVDLRRRAPARFRYLEHDLLLPRAIDARDGDVFHSPAQNPPRRSAMPWVQTLHDLIPLTRPDPLLVRDRRRWERIGPRLRRAAAVVAVSQFSADEGMRHFDLDARRLHVIPHGVDHEVFRPGPSARDDDAPYLVHVAAWGPHKGFDEALLVTERLAKEGFPHRLVFAGPQDSWMLEQIRARVDASGCADRVDVAGYVPDLPSLYRGAAALLMTSRCEGFGLPALEAMACGTPVVAFDNSSLPEVVGDGGVMVPDGNVDAMAAALRPVLEDPDAGRDLSQRGIARAARFRWEDAVEAHAEIFRSVVQ
jgi:glycosyltransferase involved in cell wall biosynthesis